MRLRQAPSRIWKRYSAFAFPMFSLGESVRSGDLDQAAQAPLSLGRQHSGRGKIICGKAQARVICNVVNEARGHGAAPAGGHTSLSLFI
jgi:hypothetical protein